MKRYVCGDCRVPLYVGEKRIAVCENCGKVYDLRPRKDGRDNGWCMDGDGMPLYVALGLFLCLAAWLLA